MFEFLQMTLYLFCKQTKQASQNSIYDTLLTTNFSGSPFLTVSITCCHAWGMGVALLQIIRLPRGFISLFIWQVFIQTFKALLILTQSLTPAFWFSPQNQDTN